MVLNQPPTTSTTRMMTIDAGHQGRRARAPAPLGPGDARGAGGLRASAAALADAGHRGPGGRGTADPAARRAGPAAVRPGITEAGRLALAVDMESRDEWFPEPRAALTETERQVLYLAGVLMDRLAGAGRSANQVVRVADEGGPEGEEVGLGEQQD